MTVIGKMGVAGFGHTALALSANITGPGLLTRGGALSLVRGHEHGCLLAERLATVYRMREEVVVCFVAESVGKIQQTDLTCPTTAVKRVT